MLLNSPSTQCGGRKGTWAWNRRSFFMGNWLPRTCLT